MGNQRLFLWLALGVVLYLNYQTWMHDYGALQEAAAVTAAAPGKPGGGSLADSVPRPESAGSTTAAAPPSSITDRIPAAAQAPAPAPATSAPSAPALIHVHTDVLDLDVNPVGGELSRANLINYPLHKDQPNVPVRLFNRDSAASEFVLQSGLTGAPGESQPDQRAVFTSATSQYSLPPGASELKVPLTWSDGNGLGVVKTFVFKRGSYAIELLYEVKNAGSAPHSLACYGQFLRHWEHPSRSYFDVETYAFKGPAIYDGTKYRKLNVENEEDSTFSSSITNGWLASMQHHFVAAIVPSANQPYRYQLQVANHDYLLGATGPAVSIPPGGEARFEQTIFVGPKLQTQLEAAGPRLELTADYGKLTVIAKPLFLALKWVEGVVGNWGWAIVIVTAFIKLVFYPLSQASGRSMAKMRAVAPRMKQIQDNYKDDREKLGRAMMELYKREKINPLAGCLPMVVQIPFFISFYWVLLESVEMRQAPFMLWINDLSARDPIFVLPLLMGGAMFAQYKLNPAPPDPTQAKVMQFMPLVMTGMMAWFPAGLVLYWLTNTVLSILQQWRINDVVAREAAKQRS